MKINLNNRGIILINTVTILLSLTVLGISLISLILANSAYINKSVLSSKALNIAEAGIDKAIISLNDDIDFAGETINFGEGKFTTLIEDDANNKIITSTAYIPADAPYKVERKIKVIVMANADDQAISFNYAVHINDLGLTLNANSVINGNVYSNGSITGYSNSRINGDAYAVGTISSPRPQISGTSNPGVPSQPFSTLDSDFWKAQANINNDPIVGNYTLDGQTVSLGPKKIEGNLTLNNGSDLTLNGPIHVTGDFEMNSNTNLSLNEAFGSDGTVIIVDGIIRMNSNSTINSTSSFPKGYILLASTNNAIPSVELNSNVIGGVYYALNGVVQLNANADVVAVVGRGLVLNSNAELNYEYGLANANFSTGPGGSYKIKKGTWERLK